MSNGLLTDTVQKIQLPKEKLITVKGLKSATFYSVAAKAINPDGEETDFSKERIVRTSSETPDQISNLRFVIFDKTILIKWDRVNNTKYYEVEVDGNLSKSINNKFEIFNADLGHRYNIRVRGVNLKGAGEYSEFIRPKLGNSVKLDAIENQIYVIEPTMTNFSPSKSKKYVVRYDTDILTVDDLCAYTDVKEVDKFFSANNYVKITNCGDGFIEFEVLMVTDEKSAVSSALNAIKFRALSTGLTDVSLEELE